MYVKESLTYCISENRRVREMYDSRKSNVNKNTHKNHQPKPQAPPPSKTIKPRDLLLVKNSSA